MPQKDVTIAEVELALSFNFTINPIALVCIACCFIAQLSDAMMATILKLSFILRAFLFVNLEAISMFDVVVDR